MSKSILSTTALSTFTASHPDNAAQPHVLTVKHAVLRLASGQQIALKDLRLTDQDLDGLVMPWTSEVPAYAWVQFSLNSYLIFEDPRDLKKLQAWAAEGDFSLQFDGYQF